MSKSASLASIPIELIDEIARYPPHGDLLAFCRVNRLVNSVCLRWIYRTVVLESSVLAVHCFRTLISNIQCAQAVRNLIIDFCPETMLNAFSRILRAALRKLNSLESIDVSASTDIFWAISNIHLPRLRLCCIPFTSDIVPFLQLHPKLSGLALDPVPHNSVMQWTSMDPILLPDLETFSGPEIVALSVIPWSPATHVAIFWDPRFRENSPALFEAIARSGTKLTEIQNILVTWEPSLLTAITDNIPDVTSLTVRNVSPLHMPADMEAFFSCVDATIGSLRSLQVLSVVSMSGFPDALDPQDLDREFQTVRRWGDVSSSLRCCVFPSETKWIRIRPQVWYPTNTIDSTPDMLMRFRWFVTTVITSTALPAEYLAALELIGGKDLVAALKGSFEREGVLSEFVLSERSTGISVTIGASG
ncbi:hypothetical protein DFH07DRAFT_525752 [Mycena maculata]|uniref:F-box domain-containing protein n=1 Tax=Mycena maculata TaxID=230809 RepID=A0AAD7IVQ3_9AGAR|nr:hypothetical protein DFH07DRAFT_525752 [Mycena maculata]